MQATIPVGSDEATGIEIDCSPGDPTRDDRSSAKFVKSAVKTVRGPAQKNFFALSKKLFEVGSLASPLTLAKSSSSLR